MTEQDFDVWLHGFAPEAREAPERALCRVFGIPQPAAQALIASLPRVVKRDATLAQAERLVDALSAIGGHAEVVPTKVLAAKVVVVGEPAAAAQATIVRHAPMHAERAPGPTTPTSADTVRLGTQELAAYFAPPSIAATATAPRPNEPHDTLVEPTPSWAEADELPEPAPRQQTTAWADLELSPPRRAEPSPLAIMPDAPVPTAIALNPAPAGGHAHAPMPELEITRNAHEWLASVSHLPPISLEPPSAKLLSSAAPGAAPALGWQNPLELPAFGAPPPHGLTMRTAAERARPRSMRPNVARTARPRSEQPLLSDGLAMLARGELTAVARSHPSLVFLVILVGTTLAFMVAYAAL